MSRHQVSDRASTPPTRPPDTDRPTGPACGNRRATTPVERACELNAEMREMTETRSDAGLDVDGDRLREECGVFGIFGHPDAAAITALGLHALQHRGQEAAGIVSFDGKRFHSERRMGLVGDNFSRREV